jgi:diketogulonate reductase-like aldo/keto reductase
MKTFSTIRTPKQKYSSINEEIVATLEQIQEEAIDASSYLPLIRDCLNFIQEELSSKNNKTVRFVAALAEAHADQTSLNLTLDDGTTQIIESTTITKIINVHDDLSEENQEKLRQLLIHNEASFKNAVDFCECYCLPDNEETGNE